MTAKSTPRISSILVTFTLFSTVASAQFLDHNSVRCEAVPKEERKPQMELQRKLTSDGWKVRQVKDFNGCYEVYGFDAGGRRVEAFFHPKTLDKLGEIKQPE